MDIGWIIVLKKRSQTVIKSKCDTATMLGYISISFMLTFSIFVMLVISLLRYHHSLTYAFLKQTVLSEAQRMAFQQLDIYPVNLKYDPRHWTVTVYVERGDTAERFIQVTVKHWRGYEVHQKRMYFPHKGLIRCWINPKLRRHLSQR